jgi:hypothetical protein
MARQVSLPVNFKIVQMLKPQTTNGALTSQVISLKGANKAWVVFEFTQAVGHATTPTLLQATNIAAATNKAGPSAAIWSNLATATTDTLVSRTAGASYALTTATGGMQVVFEIDPSTLDVNGGYDCIYFTIATSSQATNFVSATAYLQTSYQQATPPSAILD